MGADLPSNRRKVAMETKEHIMDNPLAADMLNRNGWTPETLMKLAEEGHLSKAVLAESLSVEKRKPFLEACARIERTYTEECTAKNDPCLESGCSVVGEICLQPLLNAGLEYHKACAAEWI